MPRAAARGIFILEIMVHAHDYFWFGSSFREIQSVLKNYFDFPTRLFAVGLTRAHKRISTRSGNWISHVEGECMENKATAKNTKKVSKLSD